MTRLPEFMPIVKTKMESGRHAGHYVEPELTQPVDLCDERGRLAQAAVGWSRSPLVRANLSGHWPRKKRWNFWNWIGPDFVLSAVVANIDFGAFCSVSLLDFESEERAAHTAFRPPHRVRLPDQVEETIAFEAGGIEYANVVEDGGASIHIRSPVDDGKALSADFRMRRPPGHESLNVVVPWSHDRFQLNSKHNTLPVEGEIRVGERRYVMDPTSCHAVQDWGRGIWPHRSFWNWGVATGVQDGVAIGVNVGAKWTTGTGANENGVLIDGRLHKVMEDLDWGYDPGNWMKPWRVRSPHSDAIDLTLQPRVLHRQDLNLGLLSTGGACCFGSWSGRVRVGGHDLEIRDMLGWAEEFAHRW